MSSHADFPRSEPVHVGTEIRRALTGELPVQLRRVYRSVLEHTLSQGVPVDPSAVAVVLSVLDERCEDPLLFIPERIEQLVWFEVAEFCAENRITVPQRCVEALFAVMAISLADPTLGARAEDPEAVFGALAALSH